MHSCVWVEELSPAQGETLTHTRGQKQSDQKLKQNMSQQSFILFIVLGAYTLRSSLIMVGKPCYLFSHHVKMVVTFLCKQMLGNTTGIIV